MSGAASGSALASRMCPRLFGYSPTMLIANPCPSGNGNVFLFRRAAWNTTWMSGRSRCACVRTKALHSNTLLASGPERNSAYSSRFATPRGSVRSEMPYDSVFDVSKHQRRGQVIVIVRADARQVMLHLDAVLAQLVAIADAREHQHLRRQDRASAQHDFAPRDDLALAVRLTVARLAVRQHFHASRAAVLDDDTRATRVSVSSVRLPRFRALLEIRRRRRDAPAVENGALTRAEAFRVRAVEIAFALVAQLTPSRAGTPATSGFGFGTNFTFIGPPCAVIGRARGTLSLCSERQEVRHHFRIAPAGLPAAAQSSKSRGWPRKYTMPLIGAPRAADHVPARHRNAPVVEVRLRGREEPPVELRRPDGRPHGGRNVDEGMRVIRPRLDAARPARRDLRPAGSPPRSRRCRHRRRRSRTSRQDSHSRRSFPLDPPALRRGGL